MAFKNNRFRGTINGKTLNDYYSKLDYDLETLEERMECVKELFSLADINDKLMSGDEFWQEVFDMGVCKSNLNTTDDLWTDINVCEFVSRCGDYLLAVYKQEDSNKQNIKIYNNQELFDRVVKEQSMMKGVAEANQSEILVFVSANKNYKLAKDIVVEKKDIDKYPEIKAYKDFKDYLLDLHKNPKKRNQLAERKGLSKKMLYSMLNRNRKQLDDDMLHVKISKDRPIIWKSPLKDGINEIDWDYLDMFDSKHVKPLLQVKKDIDISSDILIDIYTLIENTELTDRQVEILNLWRDDKSLQEIADILGMGRQTVSTQLDKIVKQIINSYEKEYEENYYYLNVTKGKYKTCSKCGEIKLIQRFDKNGKRGYMSMCKSCR